LEQNQDFRHYRAAEIHSSFSRNLWKENALIKPNGLQVGYPHGIGFAFVSSEES